MIIFIIQRNHDYIHYFLLKLLKNAENVQASLRTSTRGKLGKGALLLCSSGLIIPPPPHFTSPPPLRNTHSYHDPM